MADLLYIVGAEPLSAGDQALLDVMETDLGHTVTVVDDDAVVASDLTGKDAVVISESTSSGTVWTALGTDLYDFAGGIVCLENGLWDDLDLTEGTTGTDRTGESQFQIINDSHPIAGGLDGDGTTPIPFFTSGQTLRSVADTQIDAGTNTPVVTDDGSTSTFYSWAYDSGATLGDGATAAPGKRVAVGWKEAAPSALTDEGKHFYGWCVDWAAGVSNQIVLPDSDLLTTGWTETGGNSVFWDELDDNSGAESPSPDGDTTMVTSGNNPDGTEPLVVGLAAPSDPGNANLHTLVVVGEKNGGRTITLTIELRQDYVSEGDLGTLIATRDVTLGSTHRGWVLRLTDTEANNITNYSGLSVRFVPVTSGGGPKTTADITFVRFDVAPVAATTDRLGRIYVAEMEVPLAPRLGRLYVTEMSVPDAPRLGRIYVTEMEVPTAPRLGRIYTTEMSVPLAPRLGRIYTAEFEAPLAPRLGRLYVTELEVPDVSQDRLGRVYTTELEVPLAPRLGRLYVTEMSVPDTTRLGRIYTAEMGAPDAPRLGRLYVTELETPDASRLGRLYVAEMEVPTAPRLGRLYTVEFATPDPPRLGRLYVVEFEVPNVGGGGLSNVRGAIIKVLRDMANERGLDPLGDFEGLLNTLAGVDRGGPLGSLREMGATAGEIVGAVNELAGTEGLGLEEAVRRWAESGNF